MKYTEKEWLEIVSKNQFEGGRVAIISVILNESLELVKVEIRCDYSSTLSGDCELSPKNLLGFDDEGERFFVREEDGSISLFIGDKFKPYKEPIKTKELKNPKVIPFAKWKKDIVELHNLQEKDKSNKYREFICRGCELNSYGFIRGIRFRATYNLGFDSDKLIRPIDILVFTYGMNRFSILDEWCPGAVSREDSRKCYFDESFNLIFDDDEGYSINEGYFCNDKGVRFSPF